MPTWYATRRYCVIALYFLSAFWGVVQVATGANALVYVTISLLFGLAATHWATTDAKIRNRRLLPIVQAIYFFTWPVATPIYLIFTRGWRGLGLALLHGLGLMLTMCLTFYPTYFLLHWLGVLHATG